MVVRPQIQATLLTIIAGIADAVGYITMGGVFAANMTGNTVLAGIALAEGRYPDAGRHLAPLVAFFIGAMLARLLLRLWHRPMIPILLEAAIIGAMGFLPLANESAVLVLAFADGPAGLGHHPVRRRVRQHRGRHQHARPHRRRRARPPVARRSAASCRSSPRRACCC